MLDNEKNKYKKVSTK